MAVATIFEGLTLGTLIAIIYLLWRVTAAARSEGAREEKVKGEIVGLQRQIDYLDQWRTEHINRCSSEHREIAEKVDQVHEDIGELKIAVAAIKMWMQGRGPTPPNAE